MSRYFSYCLYVEMSTLKFRNVNRLPRGHRARARNYGSTIPFINNLYTIERAN